jgi:pyridoxine 5-phosphate synthase
MAMNLSVNLNKVALLRNSRGADNPSPVRAAITCIEAGAAGLTLHWREDNRHTRQSDVRDLRALARERGVEFNLEGDVRDELVALALELEVTQLTLVPVTPGEITSDHGWDLPRQSELLKPIIAQANDAGVRTSIFMDPVPQTMERAAQIGAQRVEIYTEPYAAAFHTAQREEEFSRLRETCRLARQAGLGVNAGHDLDLKNTPILAREIPEIEEVSIGHALLCDALYMGLFAAVRAYVEATRGNEVEAPVTR